MSAWARLRRWAFWPMVWKEFVQMRRDRLTFAMLTVLPAVQLVLFGYAVQTEVRHIPMVVVDASRTVESRALVDALANTGNFRLLGAVPSEAAARAAIESGEALAALIIPPDHARRLARGEAAPAQLLVDAADPQSSAAALSAAQLAAAARSTALQAARLPAAGPADGSGARVDLRVRPWYNPEQRSAVFIVPGIVGVLLTITMTLLTSTAVVRERERGTLEQLVVTPIDKTSLMLGKLVPFILAGYVQMSVILGLGWLIFDIPVRGALPLLYLLTFPFITASLGVGLLLSTLARTQAQAMQLSFFFLLPNILLSGYIFPRMAMPEPAQWVGLALPLTYFLQVLRGVLLKGVGFGMLWEQAAALVAFSVLLLALSVRRFHKTIE